MRHLPNIDESQEVAVDGPDKILLHSPNITLDNPDSPIMQLLVPATIVDLLKLEMEDTDDIIDDSHKLDGGPHIQELQLAIITDVVSEFIILPLPATIADDLELIQLPLPPNMLELEENDKILLRPPNIDDAYEPDAPPAEKILLEFPNITFDTPDDPDIQLVDPAIIVDCLKLETEHIDEIIADSAMLFPVVHEPQLLNITVRALKEPIVLQRPAIMADSDPRVELALATIKLVVPTINVKRLLDVIPTPVPNATCVESIADPEPPPDIDDASLHLT